MAVHIRSNEYLAMSYNAKAKKGLGRLPPLENMGMTVILFNAHLFLIRQLMR